MKTRNPKIIIILLTLTALAVSVSPALGLDPMEEILQKRQAEGKRRDTNMPGPTAADELFANQDWRNRMATQIAMAIEGCRYTGPLEELQIKYKQLREKDPDGAATAEVLGALRLEGAKAAMGDSARMKIAEMFSALERLNDPRVVPLIAPALRETSPGTYWDDSGVAPPQRVAAGVLRAFADRKVITIADPKQSWDYSGWGSWWKENKLDFDQVPEPLRAIDEGRITKTLDPNSVAPEGKPSPETLAQFEAKKALEVPAAPPQATPEKPAPAVATSTVTRSGDTSVWFPIAAASTAILLAAGIWFYSRTARA